MLARDLIKNATRIELDKDFLALFVNRMIKDVGEVRQIEKLVRSNIQNNNKILEQLEKSLLTLQFTQEYLMKFLSDGTLSKEDLLSFYSGDQVRAKFKEVDVLG